MTNYEKLLAKLTEMFQLDRADLDFGIYRIMNSKRDEILRFLERDLLPQVKEVLAKAQGEIGSAGAEELRTLESQVRAAGMSPDDSPKVRELRARYSAGGDLGAVEQEVFNHLYSFFRRYYDEGDFLSLRRYKEGVYAIPYEGEEVKLHWANADQYYIKTAEHFRDYAFKVGDKRVHFKLVDAQTERDNNKEKEKRVFILIDDNPIAEENGELVIRFEYRTDPAKRKQKDLNVAAEEAILEAAPAQWRMALASKAPTDKDPNRTVLAKHLAGHTARNTFDYFIHKDLGGFLRRELDFYIKNEVIHLDDIENETAPRVEQYLAKARAIRRVAEKLITFLAQLEEFQKKLWLKKKFVVETQYLVTLDLVPGELYPEIAANDAQREEWVRLFGIDKIRDDLTEAVPYSVPLPVMFLSDNPSLPIDTKHFDTPFKDRLIRALGDLYSQTNGTLVHGENFQALVLLEQYLRRSVDLVYIDPPYNTGVDDFPYKDSYQHSSWLSLVSDRLDMSLRLLSAEGVFACSLDDNETYRFGVMVDSLGPRLKRIGEFVWRTRNTDNRVSSRLSVDHEYIHVFAPSGVSIEGRVIDRKSFKNPDRDPRGPYTTDPLTGKANAQNRPNLHYAIANPETGDEYLPQPDFGWITDKAGFCALLKDKRIYWPKNPKTGNPRKKRFLSEAAERAPVSSLEIGIMQGEGNRDLTALFGEKLLNFPKPASVMKTIIDVCCRSDGTVVDFFAGSGTTGEAIIRLNREEDCKRKFVLVEVSDYFDLLLKPRVLKTIGASSWDSGSPKALIGSQNVAVKYIRLESYEDVLNNLDIRRAPAQQDLLDAAESQGADRIKEQYLLRYMLDVETADSPSMLNIQAFDHPFDYKLKIATDTVGETRDVNVDLVETFNWLLGLRVHTMDVIHGFHIVTGRLPGPGNSENGDKALILWRDTTENPNEKLDEFFRKQSYNTRDQEFDVIYVNGDNHLQNLRKDDETWKVRLIEEEFHRLMWDAEDV